jgi:hypothetical protein
LAAGASPQRVNAGGHVPYKLAKQQKHADCYKTLKPLTNKAVARDKSPRKVFGAVTVSRGLVAAADKQQLLRQPPPQQPHAPQRMQSAPAIQRAGAASAAAEWECPSCNYVHNTAALCAVCSVARPSFLAPPTNPEPPRTPSPTGSLRGPRRLDSAVQEALARLELASYADVFVENEIDFGALLLLSESDLKDLGITALGPRRKLLAFIQDPSFQPFKPGAAAGKSAPMSPAAAASQSAPPLLPGTMQAPMVPRELFQSSGQSMYERAPPPDAKFGDVTSTARERHALAHSGQSPYSELPALQAQRGASQPRGLQRPLAANADNPPYNPIPLVRPQADAGHDDDSGRQRQRQRRQRSVRRDAARATRRNRLGQKLSRAEHGGALHRNVRSINQRRSVGQIVFAVGAVVEQQRVEQLGDGRVPDLLLFGHVVLLQHVALVRHLNDRVHNASVVVPMRQRQPIALRRLANNERTGSFVFEEQEERA